MKGLTCVCVLFVLQAPPGIGRLGCGRGPRHHCDGGGGSEAGRCSAGAAALHPGCVPGAQGCAQAVPGAYRRVLEACEAKPVNGLSDRGPRRLGAARYEAGRHQQGGAGHPIASSSPAHASDGESARLAFAAAAALRIPTLAHLTPRHYGVIV